MADRKIPLDLLVDNEKNIYELSLVAMKDVDELASDDDSVAEDEFQGRPLVSVALDEVLHDEVEYRHKETSDTPEL